LKGRLFVLDVPENDGVVAAARSLPDAEVTRLGPYVVIASDRPLTLARRETRARHAVWYSCVAGLQGWRIVQWDKDALRTAERDVP
jgi:hypothetical protein